MLVYVMYRVLYGSTVGYVRSVWCALVALTPPSSSPLCSEPPPPLKMHRGPPPSYYTTVHYVLHSPLAMKPNSDEVGGQIII